MDTIGAMIKETIDKLPHYIVASVLMSSAVVLLKSHGLTTGGFPGISIISSRVWDMSVGTILTLINLPILWLACVIKGKLYVVRTVTCIALFAIMADVLVFLFLDLVPTMSLVLVAVVSGVLSGLGVVYFMLHGGNSGGAMIAIQLLSERLTIPIAYLAFAFDGLVVLWGWAVALTLYESLYSIITIAFFALTTFVFKVKLQALKNNLT